VTRYRGKKEKGRCLWKRTSGKDKYITIDRQKKDGQRDRQADGQREGQTDRQTDGDCANVECAWAGVNFIKILRAAFARSDPKCAKKTVKSAVSFWLKVACKMLMKSIPGVNFIIVLRAAFIHGDPKIKHKNVLQFDCIFCAFWICARKKLHAKCWWNWPQDASRDGGGKRRKGKKSLLRHKKKERGGKRVRERFSGIFVSTPLYWPPTISARICSGSLGHARLCGWRSTLVRSFSV